MIPKKPKVITNQVAEELNIDQALVDDLIDFYYKDIRTALSNLEHLRINLPGLGQFQMRKPNVLKLIKKYESIVKKFSTDTFTSYHNKKQAQEKLEALNKALVKINELLETKKQFKDGRKSMGSVEE
jgi:hypothetical protein